MQLSQSLNIKQKQSLVMTPQLQQAIKLLQLTNLELKQFLEEQTFDNPFINVEEETKVQKIKILRLIPQMGIILIVKRFYQKKQQIFLMILLVMKTMKTVLIIHILTMGLLIILSQITVKIGI